MTPESYHLLTMGLTSLVVCADAKAVQVLSRVLREMGIRTEHCGVVDEAAVRLKSERFDTLLVDCETEAPARELIAAAKASSAHKNVLIIALVDTANDVRGIFADGANFALYRPVTDERASNSLRAARSLMPNERRRKPRVSAHAPVSISYATSENVPANLLDLSEDGIAIKAERALPPFCKVYFEFKLPEQTTVIRLSGDVMWTDFMGRVGLQFSKVPQSSRQVLDAWLRENVFHQIEAGSIPPGEGDEQPTFEMVQPEGALTLDGNRRIKVRLACQLGAEIYSLGSNVPNRCNLSDIGPGGCYVETVSPFSPGTVVEIVVRTEALKVRLKGKVRSTHPGYGMGVEFVVRTREDRVQVERLISSQKAPLSVEQT